jgi:putative nucleotidyltransferase with HDIG domain
VPERPSRRELAFESAGSVCFATVAVAVASVFPAERAGDWLVAATLVVAMAVARQVKFEVGYGYAVPTQVVFVPMLLLLPVGWVLPAVLAASLLGNAPGWVRRKSHLWRVVHTAGDCWYAVGPVLLVGLAAPGEPRVDLLPVYAAALLAQFAFDIGISMLQDWGVHSMRPDVQIRLLGWVCMVDLLLAPIGLAAALASVAAPYAFLLVMPLVALLALFAHERSARIDHAVELGRAYRGTTLLLSDVLGADDEYTGNHSHGVVALALTVAQELGLDETEQRNVEFGALLHDVGKIAIPNEIINKPGPLDDDEWLVIKTHTVEGQRMLDQVGGVMRAIGQIVRSSHERWDGGGYPDGLAGDAIPRESRIVACCDAFNAMTTDRSYRRAMSLDEALVELRINTGTQFDPEVVEAVVAVVEREAVVPAAVSPAGAPRATAAPPR